MRQIGCTLTTRGALAPPRLRELQLLQRGAVELGSERLLDADDLDDLEDAPEQKVAQVEEEVHDQATAARTIDELKLEIANLRRLEAMAPAVRQSGEDRKWRELASLPGEIFTPAAVATRLAEEREPYQVREVARPAPSPRQKLMIFTEHRDTLNYLAERITTLLGRSEVVVAIHYDTAELERGQVLSFAESDPPEAEGRIMTAEEREALFECYLARVVKSER
jgi:hypothetical protein